MVRKGYISQEQTCFILLLENGVWKKNYVLETEFIHVIKNLEMLGSNV
jgi:hypothetical protein